MYGQWHLVQKYPNAGGGFTFTKMCFGRNTAYVCGWFLVVAYLTNVPMNSTELVYGNIEFIWNIEYSWREEGGDCTDDSRSIARHFCCDIDDSSLSEQ